ncbi:hypothetical protein QVD17_21852 [Tagetes erecta]|uniref:Glucose/ribitol dehydrogenase n=1 Tax=Tagetes erecta TaxID=13708 RepID=A0AAD8KEZ1_TARER|nr:hypothetical protein QVD17_21852 [Tagetes erecta]
MSSYQAALVVFVVGYSFFFCIYLWFCFNIKQKELRSFSRLTSYFTFVRNVSMDQEKRYAIVTGGNRGIGLEICRQLASVGVEVILTSRDQSRGEEAVEKLNASGLSNVVFHQLDINDPTSIACLVKFIQTCYGKLDMLVQVLDENVHLVTNFIREPYELGEKCLKTNYYATKTVTESLMPLLQLSRSPRIVNLTSTYGDLYWFHNEKLKKELEDIDNLTEERIEEIIQGFLTDFKAGKLQENGWPLTVSAYKVSKAALNAYTRLMARKYDNMLVNCVHPGYVITDMTSQTGFLTAEEGAKGPVMTALLSNNGPSGVYFDQTQIGSFSSKNLPYTIETPRWGHCETPPHAAGLDVLGSILRPKDFPPPGENPPPPGPLTQFDAKRQG